MKLYDTDTTPVEIKGGQAINLTMDVNSAIGFSLSIDKLYTHKVESVIREICSNARDSMVSAGRGDIPFDIYLPNDLSPYLVIKDTGLGLTKEDAITYLSTLYKSTKTNENQSVGSYGIGSKSPFAISDSYNIECIKDGKKCSFQFFRSGRSLPQLILLDDSETDEPNGVTFRIHVRDTDVDTYTEALQTQLFMFNPKPNVDGIEWSFRKPTEIFSNSQYSLYTSSVHRSFFGKYALEMGGVTYPFKPSEVSSTFSDHVDAVSRDMSWDDIMVFHMPIGEVEVPGDRERIEYSDWTINNLKIRLGDCFTDYFQRKREGLDEILKGYEKDPISTIADIKAFYKRNSYALSYLISKGEIDSQEKLPLVPVFSNKTSINNKGEEIPSPGFSKSLGDIFTYDSFKINLPYAKKTIKKKIQTKLEDGSTKTVETINEVIVEKYSTADGSTSYGGEFSASGYKPIETMSTSYNLSERAIVLIDAKDRPYLKTTTAAHPNLNNCIFVRCNGDVIDFTEYLEALEFFNRGKTLKILKLSEMEIPKKEVERNPSGRFNAVGVREWKIDNKFWNRSDSRPIPNPLQKLKPENMQDYKPDYYAFFDSNHERLYFDSEFQKPFPTSRSTWMRSIALHEGKTIMFLSKSVINNQLPALIDMGVPPLSSLFDIGQKYKELTKEEKRLMFNLIKFEVGHCSEYKTVADHFISIYCQYIFDLPNLFYNNSYNHNYIGKGPILNGFLGGYKHYCRSSVQQHFSEVKLSPEFKQQMINVLHVMTNRSNCNYVERAYTHMALNVKHELDRKLYSVYDLKTKLKAYINEVAFSYLITKIDLDENEFTDISQFIKRPLKTEADTSFLF